VREFEGVRPLVGIPIERAISYAPVVRSWMMGIAQQGWPQVALDYNRTDVARHLMAWQLLDETDCTHLIMLDIDHDHRLDIVIKLCASIAEARDHDDIPDREVVSALCFRRGKPYEPIAYREDDEGLLSVVMEWERDEVLEVDRMGFGAVIIAREVFERLPLPWFAYSYRQVESRHFPTEDDHWSRLCKAHGVKMWVDTRIRAPHLTIARVNEQTFQGYLALQEAGVQESLRIAGSAEPPREEGSKWQE